MSNRVIALNELKWSISFERVNLFLKNLIAFQFECESEGA